MASISRAGYAILSIGYCIFFFLTLNAIGLVMWLPRRLCRPGFRRYIGYFPRLVILLSGVSIILLGIYPLPSPTSAVDALELVLLVALLGTLLHVFVTAAAIANRLTNLILDNPARENRTWPERLFLDCLSTRADIVFVRIGLNNTLVMALAVVGIAMPWSFGLQTACLYLGALLSVGYSQEALEHTDVHRDIFRFSHITPYKKRVLLCLFRFHCRFSLNILCGRIPMYYRVQHVLIHHVENNGPSDIQSTIMFDRTSFVDFSRFALKVALSHCIPIDVYCYFVRKKRLGPLVSLSIGVGVWYLVLAVLAVINLWAALLVMTARLLSGVLVANNIFTWHGLIDPQRPNKVRSNSINLLPLRGAPPAIQGRHIDHHLRPDEHWTDQVASPVEADTITLSPDNTWQEFTFIKALWLGEFEVLSRRYFRFGDSERPVPAVLLQALAQATTNRTPSFSNLDRWLGTTVAYFLVPGAIAK